MERLIWLLFLGGGIFAQLFLNEYLGSDLTWIVYMLLVMVVLRLLQRPLVLVLTHIAVRFGLARETIAKMPSFIHLTPAPTPSEVARPLVDTLLACKFLDAGSWNIVQLPLIQVSLMVHPDDALFVIIESEPNFGTHVTVHTLYDDGRLVTFSNSVLPGPPKDRPGVTRTRLPRYAPGALTARARRERPSGYFRAVTVEEARGVYEQLYAEDIRFRKRG